MVSSKALRVVRAGGLLAVVLVATGCNGYFAWGPNGYGSLGTGDTKARTTPTPVGEDVWASLSAGTHSCGVKANGTMWCWGFNGSGQLGIGSKVNRSAPVLVGKGDNWATVSTGASVSCGVRTNGTLWCWGYNRGLLGDGSAPGANADRTSPVQIGTARDWSSISNGLGDARCGLKTNGTLWCWGNNGNANVGDGSTTNRAAPTQIGTSQWKSVSVGLTSCAIRNDNTLWCWGQKTGDGTSTTRTSPVQVGSQTWKQVSAGGIHNCAIRSDDGLFCWGYNGHGQLGIGGTTDMASPTKVGSNTWSRVAAGYMHTCAIRTEGTLWCWGYNGSGAVGDGKTVDRKTPVQIGSLTTWTILDADEYTLGVGS